MISKGEFGAEVLGGTLTTAQGTGTEQVAVQFRIWEGPDEGSTISEYLALTDAALPYSIEKLRTCGWTGDDISDLSMIAGTRVRLKIIHEEYNGRSKARVKFINAWREPKKLEAEAQRGIADRLRSKIAALDAAAGRAVASSSNGGGPPGEDPPPPGDDDIPF